MAEFRRRVADKLIENSGFIRDLARLIAEFVPTFSDEVHWHFGEELFPSTVRAESIAPTEELFQCPAACWLDELFTVIPKSNGNWDLSKRMESFIAKMCNSNGEVLFLIPEHSPNQTVLRLLVGHSDALVFSFSYRTTSYDAYRRLNQRILLFLSDLKSYAPSDPYINGWAKEMVNLRFIATAYERLERILLPRQDDINGRNERLFQDLIPGHAYSRVNKHIEQFWAASNRSAQTREAIWRGLEDILDLVLHAQIIRAQEQTNLTL